MIEQIRAYQEIGVNHFMAFMNFGGLEQKKVLRSMELFAKHVIPVFSDE